MLSRPARLVALAGAAAVFALSAAPSSVADSSGPAVCASQVISGVEVDNCVPNPNANSTSNVPGFNVELEGGVGVGVG